MYLVFAHTPQENSCRMAKLKIKDPWNYTLQTDGSLFADSDYKDENCLISQISAMGKKKKKNGMALISRNQPVTYSYWPSLWCAATMNFYKKDELHTNITRKCCSGQL